MYSSKYNKILRETNSRKCLLTGDGYCTREIKMRILIAKEAFNRKISLLTSKLNIDEALLYMAVDTKKIGAEVF